MAVPKVPTFNDWHFELVNLATGSFTNLDQSIVAISGWVGPGATRHRLESAHLEILDGSVGAIALSWAGIQLLRIVPYADPTHELWGYISKDRFAYSKSGHRDSIKVTVLPIEYLLHSRIVYETDNAAAAPVAIATEAAPNNTGGDYAKTLLTACTHGRYPTAAAADTRDWAWGTLFVAAQVHDGTVVAPPMSIIGGFLDETIDALAKTYAFDWELYVAVVAGVVQFTFTTADAGGTDLTAGAARVIINDIGALVPSAERFFDRQGMINAMHGGSITTAVLDAPEIVTWGRWEGETQTSVDEELALVLNMSGIKEGSTFEFQASAASIQCQWMDEYEVGDTVKRNNIRLGIADSNEIIRGIEFSFKQRVLETRIRWGNKEPGDKEKTRQGRYTPFPPVSPTLWSRHAASAYLYPTSLGDDVRLKDAAGVDKLTMDGATGSQDWADAAQMTWESIDYRMPLIAPATGEALIATAGVPNQLSWGVPASSYWERGDLDSGAGVTTGLFTRFAGDPVMIGADNADLTATPWVGTSGGTKLDVRGLLRVARGIYCNEASLALWGITGGVPIVHIVDESAAVGGAGGGACRFDVWNAAVRHHMLDADIARASYVRGFFEVHDAAGAIGHTFNAVTGVVTLNVQRLAGGDFSVLAQAAGVTLFATDANTRDFILNNVRHLWPAADAAGALISDGGGGLSWGAPAPAAHNILSASHGDTLAAGVVDGDVIIGNVTPAWSRLARQVPAANVRNVLGIDNGDLRPSWKTALDGVNPTAIGINDAAAPGVSLIFSHRDHQHSSPATWTATAHNLLSAIHGDAVVSAMTRGDLIVGTAGGWDDLAIGAANRYLHSDATDATWQQVSHTHLSNINPADHQALVTLGAPLAANLLGLAGQALSLDVQAANLVFSGPAAGGAAAPTFRALVAADLPAASNIWTKAAANVYTTTANDCVVPNAGTGTLGLVGDPWDMAFLDAITMTNGGWIGIGAALERIVFDAAGDIDIRGANLEIWDAGDLLVYDGAPGNLKASIDGATGNIQVGWGSATPTVFFGDANSYIRTDATPQMLIATDATYITLAPGGGSEVICRQGRLYPAGDDVTQLGWLGARSWSNVVSVLGNFSGTITASSAGVAVNATGDVTIAGAAGIINTGAMANRNVLISNGVRFQGRALVAADLGGHVHINTFGATPTLGGSAHNHTVTGQTDTWVAYGAVSCISAIRDSGCTARYVYIADNNAGLNARWEYMYVGQREHYHPLTGGVGTAATNNENAHVHTYQKTVTPTQGPS